MRLMLPVNFEEGIHRNAELAHGKGRPVDENAPTPIRADLALDDHLNFGGIDADLIERVMHRSRHIEDSLGRHPIRPGANHLRRPARSPQKLERVDQQRLPRPRLARQHIQPHPRLDRELLDNREVADLEIRDHDGKV